MIFTESDWPEAFEEALHVVVGTRHHCGIADCCGAITREQMTRVEELAANLVGLESYPPDAGQSGRWFGMGDDAEPANKKG